MLVQFINTLLFQYFKNADILFDNEVFMAKKILRKRYFFRKFLLVWLNKVLRCKEDLDQRIQTKNATFIFYFIVTRFISTDSTTLNFEGNAAFSHIKVKK